MSSISLWAVAAAAFFLGQVAIISGLILLERRKAQLKRTREAAESEVSEFSSLVVDHNASAWLLCAVLATAFTSFGDLLRNGGLGSIAYWLSPMTDSALLILGPALWFFTCSVTWYPHAPRPSWQMFAVHTIPATIVFVALLGSLAIADPVALDAPAERSVAEVLSLAPVALHLLVYLIALQLRLLATRRRLVQQVSNLEHRRLIWLSISAWMLKALLVLWVISWAWDRPVSDLLTNLLLAIWLLVVGLFGIHQHNVFSSEKKVRGPVAPDRLDESHAEAQQVSVVATLAGREPVATEAVTAKYAKAGLASVQMQTIAERLKQVMGEEKLYLDHDLSLSDLAHAVGCTPHQLSQVLSSHLGESFYDHVNAWRVRAVQSTLMRPQSTGRPLLEVAFECGFGSKSAFNEAFKRVSGMSPSAYRKGLPGTARSLADV